MISVISRRFLPLMATIGCVAWLAGCGGVRLQTPEKLVQEASKAAQAHARRNCDQYRDSREYFDCRKRVDQGYDTWREERAAKVGE